MRVNQTRAILAGRTLAARSTFSAAVSPLGITAVRLYSGSVNIPRERAPVHLGVVIVPQQKAYVIERLGKYAATLDAGLHFLIPLLDRVAAVHSLKEQTITVPGQAAITKDNVRIDIDGVLYMRIVDPKAASYGVADPFSATVLLAQTTMRSELGKITLDRVFEERDTLNRNIVEAVNLAAEPWGVSILRFELRDITVPRSLQAAMDLQAEAERRKRADILESEGRRQSSINIAEGQRASAILSAEGEAQAVLARAKAAAEALSTIGEALQKPGGREAVSLRVAEQYLDGFSKLARSSTTMLLPADAGSPSSMIAQAMSVWKSISAGGSNAGAAPSSSFPSSSSSSSGSSSKPVSAASVAADAAASVLDGFKPKPY